MVERQSEPSDAAAAPGDPAPDSILTDERGQLVRLSDFWIDRPLVLLFVRHFG